MYDDEKNFGKNRAKLEKLILREKEKTNNRKETHQNFENNLNTSIALNPSYTSSPEKNQNRFNIPGQEFSVDLIKMSKNKIFNWLGIPKKYDEMIYFTKWWKFYDNCITAINILIILLAFYDYELNFSYPRKIIANYNSVRLIMISLAFISIFCVFRRHHIKTKWKNAKNGGKFHSEEQYDTSNSFENFLFEKDSNMFEGKKENLLSFRFYFDVTINLVMPIPGVDFHIFLTELDRDANQLVKVDYLLSDFLYIVVLLRSLYIIRACINYSVFSDLYAVRVCKDYRVSNNIRFALKCLIKIYHIKLVLWFFFGSVLIFGFMLRIFERPFWVEKGRIEFDSYVNPMWCAFITMLTIGYGDFSPITGLGKIVVFFIGLWGVFISSLIIVCLHGLLDLSNDQFVVFTKVLKSRVAINFIESAYIFHKKRYLISRSNIGQSKDNYNKMFSNFREFKNMRNESKSIYRSNGLMHYNMKLSKEIKKLNQRMDKIEIDMQSAIRKKV